MDSEKIGLLSSLLWTYVGRTAGFYLSARSPDRRNTRGLYLVPVFLRPNRQSEAHRFGHAHSAIHQVYTQLAKQYELAFVPFFLEGVATNRELMQRDGIHPTAEAQQTMLDNVWAVLEPWLKQNS